MTVPNIPPPSFKWVTPHSNTHRHGCILASSHMKHSPCLVPSSAQPVPVPFATPGLPTVALGAPGKFPDAHKSLDCSHGSRGANCKCYRRPIDFYVREQHYFGFTNRSSYAVHFKGLVYPTSEHLFQAHKFLGGHPNLAERIRTCTTAREARELAEANMAFIRPDWAAIRITVMDDVLAHKFAQHPDLAQLLKWTGRRELRQLHELRKNSPRDAFWGVGEDGQGRNELGKALMRLRSRL